MLLALATSISALLLGINVVWKMFSMFLHAIHILSPYMPWPATDITLSLLDLMTAGSLIKMKKLSFRAFYLRLTASMSWTAALLVSLTQSPPLKHQRLSLHCMPNVSLMLRPGTNILATATPEWSLTWHITKLPKVCLSISPSHHWNVMPASLGSRCIHRCQRWGRE